MIIVDVVTSATIGVVKKSLNVTRQRTIHGANGAGGSVAVHIHFVAEL